MNRPRKSDRHLPACVYERRGKFYYVKAGKWRPLGADLQSALYEYARIVAQPTDGMANLIDQALPDVLRDRKGRPLRPSTTAQYTRAAAELREALAEFRPQQLRAVDVRTMLDDYRDTPAVANRLLVVLGKVCQWAVDRGIIDANPAREVTRYIQTPRDRLIAPGELAAIRALLTPRMQCIVDMAYLTGQRIGDVLAIRRADLVADGIAFTQQKTGTRLVVAWTPELRAAVDRARALTGNLVPQTLFYARGGPPKYQHVWRAFHKAAERAGVANVTLHDLRAMAATEADADGLDARGLLGHRDRRTTEIYLRSRRVPVVRGPRKTG